MEVIQELAAAGPFTVDFFYAPALFSRPHADEGAILDAGPVTDFFAGWVPELDRPPVGLVGVGYGTTGPWDRLSILTSRRRGHLYLKGRISGTIGQLRK